VQPFSSVAAIVKLKEPTVVGVPVMTPVEVLSDRPIGRGPVGTEKVYVPGGEAETVWLYAVPTAPLGSVLGLTVTMGHAAGKIRTEYAWLPMQPLVSVAVIVKSKGPTVFGVPVMAPDEALSDRPLGRSPTVTRKVYVPGGEAETVWLYAVPTAPLGSVLGLSVTMGHAAGKIRTEYAWLPVQPFVSVAVMVKPKRAAVVGVPVMAPVEALSDRPLGSAPIEIEKVYAPGGAAETVWL
jgi:translation initiation factor IF-1